MIILGIHDGHNASAAILIDGKIVGAVQEERFTRIKNHYIFPGRSIEWLLESNNLGPDDVTTTVYCNHHMAKSTDRESLKAGYYHSEDRITKAKMAIYWNTPLGPIYRRRRRSERLRALDDLGFKKDRVLFEEHHYLHACAAYYSSGWFNEKVLVLTVDGQGDGLCGTVNIGEQGQIERIAEIPQGDSFGNMYGMVTHIMGMVPLEHEYKVMGLAPYASVGTSERGEKLFDGLFEVEKGSMVWRRRNLPPALYGYKSYRRLLENARFDVIAAGAQSLVEKIMVQWVTNCIEHTGVPRVVLSGGVGMNVKASKLLMEIPQLESIFVMPSCGDESNPIGACYSQYMKEGGNLSDITPLTDLYLGPEYSPDRLFEIIDESRYDVMSTNNAHSEAGNLIAEGEVVAVCSGRTEFGARALGNRSIVADPSQTENVRIINDMIKKRDFWMPFAPSILDKNEGDYVVNPKGISAAYMIMAFDTTERRNEIIAAVHNYDLTTRPQVIYEDWNPAYYGLIETFKKRSGIGAVLNTSFNLHGYPIVNSPEDALFVMDNSGLKHLLLDTHIISKIA
jgi:carbamoyltransferase